MNLLACLDEMVKLGTISDAEAQKAIDRLESLEKSKPTAGQVGRYGALGAVGGALTKTIGHAIDPGGKKLVGRALAASAVTGSVGSGAIPLVRAALDSAVEKHKIKKYLKQEHALPKQAAPIHEGIFAKNPAASGGPPNFEPREKVSFYSFCDELEKTALDVRLSTVPGMGACVGKYFKPEMVAQHGVLQEVAKGRPHLVVQKPLEEFRTMLSGQRDYVNNPELLDAASRAAQGMTRKHELTHYLRSKAGKMEGYGKPGALNVLRTAREELAGHRTGLRAFSKMDAKTQGEAAKGVVPGTMASLRQAYPQGLWNAVLGRSGG